MAARLFLNDVVPPYCPAGLKTWFRLHGLDFRAFLREGIALDVLTATGDQLAQQAVERKLEALSGKK